MSKEQVLTLLKEEQSGYISGQEMSRRLGITRAAVWKDVTALREDGYEIDSVTRRGYRLITSPDHLTRGEILPYLRPEAREHLICFDTIDSTNTYGKKIAMEGCPDGTAIVANEQTGGRGRRGRTFQSPKDQGIYFSLVYKPEKKPQEVINFTAYVAVAICNGIQAACGVRPGIKWTNDIVLGHKKLAGILTEMSIEGETGALQYIVTGIGVNVCQKTEDFPAEIRDIATSLEIELGHPVSRGRLAAEMINAMGIMYEDWKHQRGDYWKQYREDCLTLGQQVRLIRDGEETIAYAEDLAEDFGLIVRYPDGTREKITTGEVSVRGLFGYLS
jgi:BirA family biotin operon repressor/biotin-[acetyl-CoA-carboxylase] ligase